MDDLQLHETIEAYLRQQMPPAEAAAFEAQMAADPALAERVALHRLALRAADRLAERSMQEKFAQWRVEADADVSAEVLTEEEVPAQPVPARRIGFWRLAAALVVVLVGAFWVWRTQPEPLPPTLPTPPPPPDTPAVKPTAPVAIAPDGKTYRLLAYNEINSSERKALLRGDSPANSPKDSLAQADSLLKTDKGKDYRSAIALLKQISTDSASVFKRLAFAYHKLGRPAQAIAAYKQCERLTPYNWEEHDWLLCLYYLAGWPEYEAKFKARLDKMTGTKDQYHNYRSKALRLKQEMQAKGWKE